jgi:hypothetical protein
VQRRVASRLLDRGVKLHHSEFFRANAPIAVVKEHPTLLNDLRNEHMSDRDGFSRGRNTPAVFMARAGHARSSSDFASCDKGAVFEFDRPIFIFWKKFF